MRPYAFGVDLGGMKVCVANDANAAALGEMKHAGGWNSVVMVTLGTGVGGVIVDGKIVTGVFGGGAVQMIIGA